MQPTRRLWAVQPTPVKWTILAAMTLLVGASMVILVGWEMAAYMGAVGIVLAGAAWLWDHAPPL